MTGLASCQPNFRLSERPSEHDRAEHPTSSSEILMYMFMCVCVYARAEIRKTRRLRADWTPVHRHADN